MKNTTKIIAKKADLNVKKLATRLKKRKKLARYDLLILLVKYMIDLYKFEISDGHSNQVVIQIVSRTIMETYLYVRFLTESKGNKKKYQIKKTAYKLVSQRDELKKLINPLYDDRLINKNSSKDLLQRDKARKIVNNVSSNETRLKDEKVKIDTDIKDFLDKNSIGLRLKDFKHFYNVTKDNKGNYLQNLHDLALFVNEGERYNLLMHQTSKRVHATNVYEEYDSSTLKPKSNQDDNIPMLIGAIFVGNALKSIAQFFNMNSLFDKSLGKDVDNLITGVQAELDQQMEDKV